MEKQEFNARVENLSIDAMTKKHPHLEELEAAHILYHWLGAHHAGQGSPEYAALSKIAKVYNPGENEELNMDEFADEYLELCKDAGDDCDCKKDHALAVLKDEHFRIDEEVIKAVLENVHYNAEHASNDLDNYVGTYSSKEDWAREHISNSYDLTEMLNLKNYIDYESYANDIEKGGDMTFLDLPNGDVAVFTN